MISFFIYAMHYEFVIPTINALLIPVLKGLGMSEALAIPLHAVLIGLGYGIIWLCAFVLKRILPEKAFLALSGGRV